jgi:hypothetical protein
VYIVYVIEMYTQKNNNNNNNNTILSLTNFHNSILFTQKTNKTNFFPFFSPPHGHTYPHPSLIFSPFLFPFPSSFILHDSTFSFFLSFFSLVTTCPFNLFFILFSSSLLSGAVGRLGLFLLLYRFFLLLVGNL